MPLYFQNIDCITSDLSIEDKWAFIVTLCGRDPEGNSVILECHGFKPYFFVETNLMYNEIEHILELCNKSINKPYYVRDYDTWLLKQAKKLLDIHNISIVTKCKFRGFQENPKNEYLKLEFNTMNAYRRVLNNVYLDRTNNSKKSGANHTFESDLSPVIRFFDLQGVNPSDWVHVSNLTPGLATNQEAHKNNKTYHLNWNDIRPLTELEKNKLPVFAPIHTMLFDCEMTSEHGDFPIAIKTYLRPAQKIIDLVGQLKNDENIYDCVISVLKNTFDKNHFDRVHLKNPSLMPNNVEQFIIMKKNKIEQIVYTLTNFTIEEEGKDDKIIPWNTSFSNWDDFVKSWERKELSLQIDRILSTFIPSGVKGDKIIQIGAIVIAVGKKKPITRDIFVLNNANNIENANVHCFNSEEKLIIAFSKYILKHNPDIVSGYNIIPFDIPYLYDRALELDIVNYITDVGKIKRNQVSDRYVPWRHLLKLDKLRSQRLASNAMGDSQWRRLDWNGRTQLDEIVEIRKAHNLDSYKLDNVSSHFMYGLIESATVKGNKITIKTNDIRGLCNKNYIKFSYMHGAVREIASFENMIKSTSPFATNKSYKVKKLSVTNVTVTNINEGTYDIVSNSNSLALKWKKTILKCDRWNHAKDDVPPQEIFKLQKGTDADRTRLARYCLQDVQLTVDLLNKTLLIENAVAYSNINGIPLSWIFNRGQGAKTQAYIAKVCRKHNYVMPRLFPYKAKDNHKFNFTDTEEIQKKMNSIKYSQYGELPSEKLEGAFVLKPTTGIYDVPIAVTDYTSLYPSAMISKNMSHETIAYQIKHLGEEGRKYLENKGYFVNDVSYEGNVYTNNDPDKDNMPCDPKSVGKQTVRFISKRDPITGKAICNGIIPTVLKELLKKRKEVKKRMKKAYKEGNYFLASVLNGMQLALKITANSIYGQTGGRVSKFRNTSIASATTAEGRSMLMYAKNFVEKYYKTNPLRITDLQVIVKDATVIYGDTDSIFIEFDIVDYNGQKVTGEKLLKASVLAGEDVEKVTEDEPWLLDPHCLEYEKTFYPFIIVSKKKYVGIKFEAGKTTGKLNSMGIVLKRRDNPPILKEIYGDMIDGFMNMKSIDTILNTLKRQIFKVLSLSTQSIQDYSKFIITKRLRTGYKNPKSIAHKVLADRIAVRDPGNAPKSNDRIAYVFIVNKKAKLQGERIETVAYIKEHNIPIDFQHYVENIIMRPVSQVLALKIKEIPGYNHSKFTYNINNIRLKKRNIKPLHKIETAKIKRSINKIQKRIDKFNKKKHRQPIPSLDLCKKDIDKKNRTKIKQRHYNWNRSIKNYQTEINQLNKEIDIINAESMDQFMSNGTAIQRLAQDKIDKFKQEEVQRLIFHKQINLTKRRLAKGSALSKFGFIQ